MQDRRHTNKHPRTCVSLETKDNRELHFTPHHKDKDAEGHPFPSVKFQILMSAVAPTDMSLYTVGTKFFMTGTKFNCLAEIHLTLTVRYKLQCTESERRLKIHSIRI